MSCKLMRATLLCSVALAATPRIAGAVEIQYNLDFGIERNDNLLLTPEDPIEDTILRPGLGFSLTHESSTWQTEFTGRGEYLIYQDDRFDDTLEGVLSGRANWIVLPERLSFTVEDDLTVQPVNTFLPDGPGNRQQVNVISLGPTLFFNLGQTLQGAAELRYINSDAEITEEFNSDRVNFALRATKELDATSALSANLQVQRVDFDFDLVARDYDRTDFYARYTRSLASIDLALDAGISRIDYRRGGGNRSEPLFRVQGTWHPSARQSLSLRASSQFSDTASDALAGIGAEGEAMPGSVPIGEAVVNASPYEERGFELRYTYTTPRTTVVVAPYYNRLRYIDTDDFDQNTSGLRADVNWLARPRFTLGAYGGVGRIEYVRLDGTDKTSEFGAYADYRWTRHLSSRLSVMRQERDLTAFGSSATQNVLLLTVSYHNR